MATINIPAWRALWDATLVKFFGVKDRDVYAVEQERGWYEAEMAHRKRDEEKREQESRRKADGNTQAGETGGDVKGKGMAAEDGEVNGTQIPRERSSNDEPHYRDRF